MLKKIVIFVLIVIVLIVAGLFAFGYMNPSVNYEIKVEINKPREVVWNYFQDENKMGEWQQGFQKIESISGNKNEVGSKYRLTYNDQGNEIVMTETVMEFQAPERFAIKLEHEIMTSDLEISLTESDGKTTFVQKDVAVGSNILWRIMFAAMKSSFIEYNQQNLDKMKANVEKL
jgi:uncharacterized protein YndB with AHSA1/START domain